jgi:tetratricopeptide (TPR) repeat protein
VLGREAPDFPGLRLLRAELYWRLGARDKAESEFTAAVAAGPGEVVARLDRARALEGLGLRDRADADLDSPARQAPDDPRVWVARGRLLAERGDDPATDAACARAAALAQGRLEPFLDAGWWVAGPCSDNRPSAVSMTFFVRGSLAVARSGGRPSLWRWVPVGPDRNVDLGPLDGGPNGFSYLMTHLASDRERAALISLHASDRPLVWVNGQFVSYAEVPGTARVGLDRLIPVTLRAGRNTLVLRVGQPSGDRTLRVGSDDMESERALLLGEFGRWPEAADLLKQAEARGRFTRSERVTGLAAH